MKWSSSQVKWCTIIGCELIDLRRGFMHARVTPGSEQGMPGMPHAGVGATT